MRDQCGISAMNCGDGKFILVYSSGSVALDLGAKNGTCGVLLDIMWALAHVVHDDVLLFGHCMHR